MAELLAIAKVLAIGVGLPLVLLGFGWSILARFLPHLDPEERFAVSFAPGVLLLAATQLLCFTIGMRSTIPSALAVMLMGMLAARSFFGTGGELRADNSLIRSLAGANALSLIQLICAQCMLPVYIGIGWYYDWYYHYDVTRVLLGDRPIETTWGPWNIASRNTLFNLASASIMSLAGSDFGSFQLVATVLNWLFVPALVLVLRDCWPASLKPRIGVALIALNFWLLHDTWYTWPKMMALYFILLGLHFYLRYLREAQQALADDYLSLSWAAAVLAFLTHQAAVAYSAALVLHALIMPERWKTIRDTLRTLRSFPAIGLVLGAVWYAQLIVRFGVKYLVAASPTALMTGHSLEVEERVSQVHDIVLGPLFSIDMLRGGWNPVGIYRAITREYMSSLPGVLTLPLLLAFIVVIIRHRSLPFGQGLPARERSAVWMFIIVGTLAINALHPPNTLWGVAGLASAQFPTAVMLTVVVWSCLALVSTTTARVLYAMVFTEFLAIFWSHVWAVRSQGQLQSSSGNWLLKHDQQLVFLSDALGRAHWLFVIGAALTQVTAIVLLVRWANCREAISQSASRCISQKI